MPISEKVISAAVARYDRERDRYLKLAARVSDICRTSIVEDNAIGAQVTFRTKTVRSFEGKLKRFSRRQDKNYATVDDVFAGVGDFAGVRIATYRPEDEQRVTEEIRKLFEGESGGDVFVDKKDKLAVNSYQFYRATHCQVFLRNEDLIGNYENLRGTSCEIQVCLMMTHWSKASNKSFIMRTVGVQALFDVLRRVFAPAVLEKRNLKKEFFAEHLSRAAHIDFAAESFKNASGSGRSYIRRALEEAIGPIT